MAKYNELCSHLDQANYPALIVNKNGEIEYSNLETQKLFGLDEQDLKGLMFGIPVMPEETREINVVISGKAKGKFRVNCFEIILKKHEGYLIIYSDNKKEISNIKKMMTPKE